MNSSRPSQSRNAEKPSSEATITGQQSQTRNGWSDSTNSKCVHRRSGAKTVFSEFLRRTHASINMSAKKELLKQTKWISWPTVNPYLSVGAGRGSLEVIALLVVSIAVADPGVRMRRMNLGITYGAVAGEREQQSHVLFSQCGRERFQAILHGHFALRPLRTLDALGGEPPIAALGFFVEHAQLAAEGLLHRGNERADVGTVDDAEQETGQPARPGDQVQAGGGLSGSGRRRACAEVQVPRISSPGALGLGEELKEGVFGLRGAWVGRRPESAADDEVASHLLPSGEGLLEEPGGGHDPVPRFLPG
jgi:hypothetical protein